MVQTGFKKLAREKHSQYRGKLEITSKVPLATQEDLSLFYTPGVAEPCREIAKKKDLVYEYTSKNNLIAVVTDGSAVLGLGNIGPEAALPVMEGKAVLFKEFGQVDAMPICLKTQDPDQIIQIVQNLEPVFGGINLEDIAAPNCFYIEEKLKETLQIPVFHDDQHGTAIVVLAALINALKICEKEKSQIRVVINGAGAAGIAIAKLLLNYGVRNISLCDRTGLIYQGRPNGMNAIKSAVAQITNLEKQAGNLETALQNADVFIGVSQPNLVTAEMIKSMNADPIIFAMANPDPEVLPDVARAAGAKIVATGRSDFPNQINNVLAFPGLFRGVLDIRASQITEAMKIASAEALASYVQNPKADQIIPSPLDKEVGRVVAEAVKRTNN